MPVVVNFLTFWLMAMLFSGTVLAADTPESYADQWGPAVGVPLPLLDAPDQLGTTRSLADLAGPSGMLLFVVRSADWCPFCKRQLLQLNERADAFAALGLKVAAMSYDSREILEGFHRTYALSFPLLQDLERRHFSAYGVMNDRYRPGHRAYGIPHPGVLLVAPDGTVKGKFALPGFRQRPPFDAMLATLKAMLPARSDSTAEK